MKRIAILQSDYIPWKGYFDIIRSVDEFIIYDDAQYTRRDWRNRNLIKTRYGLKWLTIPVLVKGRYNQKICETQTASRNWAEKHWKSIKYSYTNTPFFKEYSDSFENTYRQAESLEFLSEINFLFIKHINSLLNIKTIITSSSDYEIKGNKSEKIISVCRQTSAREYLTGPSAKSYLDHKLFETNKINIIWADYSGYPEYPQNYLPFIHGVSILDLIFNVGEKASFYMKNFK